MKTDTEKFAYPGADSPWGLSVWQDPEMKDDLIEMAGRRLELLSEKIKSMPTGSGESPKLVLFFVPFRVWPDWVEPFWKDLSEHFNFPYLDLTEPYDALKISYYPAATECCDGHYTAYGSRLIGYLLSHYLVEDKLVPFEAPKKQ